MTQPYDRYRPMKPTVTLTAYNMGANATEADFDGWTDYVNEHLAEACGFDLTVDRFAFACGPAADEVTDATDEQEETIREALRALWEAAEWEPRAVDEPTVTEDEREWDDPNMGGRDPTDREP